MLVLALCSVQLSSLFDNVLPKHQNNTKSGIDLYNCAAASMLT